MDSKDNPDLSQVELNESDLAGLFPEDSLNVSNELIGDDIIDMLDLDCQSEDGEEEKKSNTFVEENTI